MTTAAITAKTSSSIKREESEWIVFLVIAVALLAGWFLKTTVEGRIQTFSGDQISLSYPAAWLRDPVAAEAGLTMKASDPRSPASYWSNVSLQLIPPAPALAGTEDQLNPTVALWTFGQSQKLSNYRVLSTEMVEVAGRPAVRINYTYVSEPIASPYRRALPVVVEAVDYLILHQDQVYGLTLAADAHQFAQEWGQLEAILHSVKFSN